MKCLWTYFWRYLKSPFFLWCSYRRLFNWIFFVFFTLYLFCSKKIFFKLNDWERGLRELFEPIVLSEFEFIIFNLNKLFILFII